MMPFDLSAQRARLSARRVSAAELLADNFAQARRPACAHAFVRLFAATAQAQAQAVDALHAAGAPLPPLAGLAISVKDLFDVAGHTTTAGSVVLADAPAAQADAAAVARLRRAGATLIGHTQMTEFAFSGLGLNPHQGTPHNPATARIDATPRIPGGSTSGGAVSVATGAAWAALGSDTGGSLRIPAALQGLVGFKSTATLVPREGTVPLSPTLDTVGAITHSVRDAVLLHEVLADRVVGPGPSRLQHLRLAVPQTLLLDGLDAQVAADFDRVLSRLSAAGAHIIPLPCPLLVELAAINAQGGFAAAEAWAWHRARWATDAARYDPRVSSRIQRGAAMSAADVIDLLAARQHWVARMTPALAGFDAMLCPTVPVVAPELAPLLADDARYAATNALLLRNPAVVNMLDGCAISVPMHSPGALPTGLMIWHGANHDNAVLRIAGLIESALAP
jgi:amidase/aspartyl-tRNA(Asn)/glutamyl-tRNA(Gln) amidotransferase subunit A